MSLISIIELEKDPALSSSYCLLDTFGKLIETILLTGIISEISGRRFLRNEMFWLRTKHSTALQLDRLVERVSRNFEKKMLRGALFLGMAKVFDNIWVGSLLYKLADLNIPSYLVKSSLPTCMGGR